MLRQLTSIVNVHGLHFFVLCLVNKSGRFFSYEYGSNRLS